MAFLLAVALWSQLPQALLSVTPINPPTSEEASRRTGVDLMLGSSLGLALRLQHRFESLPFYVEGSLGTFVLGSGIGVGVRGESILSQGSGVAFIARPGAAWHLIGYSPIISSSSSGAVALDVDLAWQHFYPRGGVGELGLKIGPGIRFRGETAEVFPVVGVFYGRRF